MQGINLFLKHLEALVYMEKFVYLIYPATFSKYCLPVHKSSDNESKQKGQQKDQ